jgi:hypothetical protein
MVLSLPLQLVFPALRYKNNTLVTLGGVRRTSYDNLTTVLNVMGALTSTSTRGLYYKTFYSRNLRIFVISWQAFPA